MPAAYNIPVIINPVGVERGARVVERRLSAIGLQAGLMRTALSRAFSPLTAAVAQTALLQRAMDRLRISTYGFTQVFANAFGLLSIGFTIRAVAQLADSFQFIQNRIRVVSRDFAQVNILTDELFRSARRARTGFSQLSEVYARTALSAGNLGVTQRELLTFTESVNKAVFISGSKPREANAALIQLSQGLASNVLRGDELRSVQEQIPYVAEIIAKSLGKTRGELREFGALGGITAEVVLKAFREFRDEIENKFNATVLTLSQSFAILTSSFTVFIGKANQEKGVLTGLAGAILLLADNLDVAARFFHVLTAAAAGFVALKLFSYIVQLIPLFRTVNGLVKIFAGVAAIGGSAAYSFGDNLQSAFQPAVTVGDRFRALLVIVGDLLRPVTDFFQDTLQVASWGEFFTRVLDGVVTAFAHLVDGTIGAIRIFQNLFIAIHNIGAPIIRTFITLISSLGLVVVNILKIPEAAVKLLVNVVEDAFTFLRSLAVSFIGNLIKLTVLLAEGSPLGVFGIVPAVLKEQYQKLEQYVEDNPLILKGANISDSVFKDFEQRLSETIKNAESSFASKNYVDIYGSNVVGAIAGTAEEAVRQRSIRQRSERLNELYELQKLEQQGVRTAPEVLTRFQKELAKLNAETAAYKLNTQAREDSIAIQKLEIRTRGPLADNEQDLYLTALAANRAAKTRAGILDGLRKPEQDLIYNQEILQGLYTEGAISLEQYTVALNQYKLAALAVNNDFQDGVQSGLIKLREEYSQIGTLVESTFVGAFRKSEDALIQFITTGKLGFKDLVQSILADLARLALRQTILNPALQFATDFAQNLSFNRSGGRDINVRDGATHSSQQEGTQTNFFGGSFARGGAIRGPGTGTSDSIPILASDGEYIVNARAARLYKPVLDYINNMTGSQVSSTSSSSPSFGSGGSRSNGPTKVEIYDQRTYSGDENSDSGISTEQSTGPDGGQIMKVIVQDVVKGGIAAGDFDRSMTNRFQVQPSGKTIRR